MSEMTLSADRLYVARPTVRVDTKEYPKVTELMLGIEMNEAEGGLCTLEMRLSNIASDSKGGADYAFEDNKILKLGAVIAVYGGDQNSPQEIFRGKITGLEASFSDAAAPELTVLAEDAHQQARMARRTKTYDNATLAGLAGDVATTLHLKPVIDGFTQNIGTQVQLNESDLAFLRRLLARYDGDMQVVGAEMHVAPRADVRRGTVTLQLGSQLHRVRVLADLAHQVTGVTVTAWDAKQGQTLSATGGGVHLGPGAGKTGKQLLQDAIGPRVHHLAHLGLTTQEEAQAVADAAFDHRARRLVCLEGTAEGNPALRVGTHVTVTGLGPRFDNTYYVVRTCHRYDQTAGYQTDFEAECAFLGS